MTSETHRRRPSAPRLCAFGLVVSVFALLLAGCGGGGSSSSSSSPSQTYALNSAISAYLQTNHSYRLTATNSGNSYVALLDITAGPTGIFNGQGTDTSDVSLTVQKNGTLVSTDSQADFFLLGPYELLGITDSTTGNVWIASSQVAIPDNATVGQSGAVDKETVYNSSETTVLGSFTQTWTLKAGPGSDAIGCIKSVGTLNGTSETDSDCYTVDTSGNVVGFSATLYVSGLELKFT